MPENQPELLLAYLRQHGGRFTVDALRRQMLSEGHAPAEVEEAIAAYQRERPAPPARPYWPLALGIAFLNLAVIVAVIASLVIFDGRMPEKVSSSLLMLLGVSLVLEPIVGVVMILVGGRIRRLGMGLLLGSVLFFSGMLLVAGALCLYFIAQSS